MSSFTVPSSTPQRISSAFNSVTEGINELKNTNQVKEAITAFTQPQDSFVNAAVLPSRSANISIEGAIPSPAHYYRQLASAEKESVKVQEIQKRLDDPKLDIAKGLEGIVKTVNDLSEMDKYDLQRFYQDYQQGISVLNSMLKAGYDDKKKLMNNIKA
jgi:hypothetical protein